MDNLYKVTVIKSRTIRVTAKDEDEAEVKALALIDFCDSDEVDCIEVEFVESNTYTDQQELQDEEKRYEDKYGY